ncbi:UNVERIFIED_CONTAM: hypothetical protein GTU68_040363 [Idotea baltica]|nr:hypothetical protein [Idotea baltica]
MSGHFCLKWNNHSSAFLNNIKVIYDKERFCDATILCQGKYFPVHRIILSTCSEYFDEIFDRMKCQHPYIVFKDIEPTEMEMLLNYMYQGEINVSQDMLPSLIKTAEALKVKGLAVPDDLSPPKESSSEKKRSYSSNDAPQPKRRLEESRNQSTDSNLIAESIKKENYPECSIDANSSELEPTDQQLDYIKASYPFNFSDGRDTLLRNLRENTI